MFAYFCVPELKERSLEEINEMFQDGTPIRDFGKRHIAVESAAADGSDVDITVHFGSKLTKLEGGREHRSVT